MDGVVAFVYATWVGLYPEMAGVNQTVAAMYFTQACQICDNTPASIITDASPTGLRAICLYSLTAHVAALSGQGAGGAGGSNGRGALVGRINSASEGSVSVGSEMAGGTASSAYFMQTQYGATYWQMTAQFRTMRYVPGPQRNMDPWGYGRRW